MKLWITHRTLVVSLSTLALLGVASAPASAQLNGANILGDTGVDSATQAPPGLWMGGLYYHYRTDTIRKADGSKLALDPTQPSSLSMPIFAPTFAYVTTGTIMGGGHYGLLVAPGFTNAALEAPGFGLDTRSSTGLADTYIVPVQIGWHLPQADVITAFGVWAPTGRYTAGGLTNNTSRGMWTYEASAGTTLFLDPQRTWSAATTAYYENHGKKKGTAVNVGPFDQMALGGVRVGDILSLEGGFAREFAGGVAHAGLAYYAQWKITPDDFGIPVTAPGVTSLSKHRVFGVGPDVSIPIATKSVLVALVNVRYFWETGAEVKTEGQSLVLSATFAVPSMRVK